MPPLCVIGILLLINYERLKHWHALLREIEHVRGIQCIQASIIMEVYGGAAKAEKLLQNFESALRLDSRGLHQRLCKEALMEARHENNLSSLRYTF